MPRKNAIPIKPRFSFATKRAYELLAALDIGEFPINPQKIIEHFPEWHLIGWMELSALTGENDPLHLDGDGCEARTVIRRGTDEYLIVYDERVESSQRIRWTLAHEIGHIVLGHLVNFEPTALNRCGLTEKEYGVLEIEAHWFAAELLAPKTIIGRFNFNDNPQGISLICDISKEAAEKRLKDISRTSLDYFSTEGKILRNFYNHLSQGGYYQVIHDTASKFCSSSIYADLCKECRICRKCGAFVADEKYRFCPICGEPIPNNTRYSPYKTWSMPVLVGTISHDLQYEVYMKGRQYYEFPVDSKNHVKFCPVCKNYDSFISGGSCSQCGSITINTCTKEMIVLPSGCRYCPYCGVKTTFNEIYDKLPLRLSADSVHIPAALDDYAIYEHWPFTVMTIGMWGEQDMDVYTALEDSVALYDGDDMVVFVRGAEEQAIAIKRTDMILKCLDKNAYLQIKHLTVLIAKPADVKAE